LDDRSLPRVQLVVSRVAAAAEAAAAAAVREFHRIPRLLTARTGNVTVYIRCVK